VTAKVTAVGKGRMRSRDFTRDQSALNCAFEPVGGANTFDTRLPFFAGQVLVLFVELRLKINGGEEARVSR